MKFGKPTAATVTRTVLLVLAIVNNALALFGKSPLPIDDGQVTAVVSFLFTAVAAFVAWWKNNSFTQAAINADKQMKEAKGYETGRITYGK